MNLSQDLEWTFHADRRPTDAFLRRAKLAFAQLRGLLAADLRVTLADRHR